VQYEADLIILGGGCAGLSLATRLAELGPSCPRTIIVEARALYSNDRTWCFWDEGASRIGSLVRHRWQKMKIQAEGRSVTVSCGATPYQMLPADVFYAAAMERIATNDRIRLLMETSAFAPPTKLQDTWHIDTSRAPCRAGMVIDTRPINKASRGAAILWQSFCGREIDCDDAVFDPTCTDLMNFSDGNARDIRFAYVLPVSPHRALIETTIFGPDPLSRPVLSNDLNSVIGRYLKGAGFRLRREEYGVLPMGTATAKADPDVTYVRAGVTGGGARASTGYAFQRIQRWADLCAKRLGEGKLPIGHEPDPLLLRAMDHLFLSVLRTRSAAAPAMFLSMFEKVDPARVIRFLSDGGTLLDRAMIACVLPVIPFMTEIPNAFLRSARLREAL
jgi:lycopene beta-cyclase